jgi:hypothetical protein
MTATHWRAAAVLSGGLLLLPVQAAISASESASHHAVSHSAVQPQSVQALRNMSAYLRTLQSFQIQVDTTREEVDEKGQKVKYSGTIVYKVRRPDRLSIKSDEDKRERELYYDGKTLTVFTPNNGFYASVPAPPTIRQTLTLAADRYNIHPPLVELFKWGNGEDGAKDLTSGRWVRTAIVNGQSTDEYAFRQKGVDWRIWIQRGPTPLPVRVVIESRAPEPLAYHGNLAWSTNQPFADNAFAFRPPAGAKQIGIASNQ